VTLGCPRCFTSEEFQNKLISNADVFQQRNGNMQNRTIIRPIFKVKEFLYCSQKLVFIQLALIPYFYQNDELSVL
jgi:hypothetical protein